MKLPSHAAVIQLSTATFLFKAMCLRGQNETTRSLVKSDHYSNGRTRSALGRFAGSRLCDIMPNIGFCLQAHKYISVTDRFGADWPCEEKCDSCSAIFFEGSKFMNHACKTASADEQISFRTQRLSLREAIEAKLGFNQICPRSPQSRVRKEITS